ncbi:MAG: hypothetical protein DRP83_01185 [Planctomycetota bacterium]|nr:MAG: hypothetical protein DRP83_01185 [Planctomycetota bacterium]
MSEKPGFLGSLFDFSFSEFVTTRVIKTLFVVAIVMVGLGTIGLIISGFSKSATMGVFMLLLSPLFFLLYVLFARIWLELIIVMFRIAENTGRLVEQNKSE